MTMRIIYILLFFVSTFSAFSATISGKLYNASTDSTVVVNHAVSLQKMGTTDHMPVQLAETTTNSSGTFSFQLSDVDTSLTYFTSTDYMGVRYYSDAVTFSGTSGSINMVVQDSTHSTQEIKTLMHHLMIEDLGSAVSVRETRVHHNGGKQTILEVMHSEKGAFLAKTVLPAGASGFQPLSEQLQNELVVEDGILYDTGIMPPGNRQVGYVYNVPWKKNASMFQIPLSYATQNFDVFIGDPNIEVISQDLEDRGQFTIRGTSYQRYGINDAPANTIVRFALQRSGKPASAQSPLFPILLTSVFLGLALILGHFSKSGNVKK